jgi:hypothetical protein
MTELLKISDMRDNHKDIPNKVDGAIKYTDGARLGVHSCKIVITDGLLTIDQGELQYGTKRYSIPSYSSSIPYCYGDTLGNVIYSTFDYVPVVWDNPNRLFPAQVDPESIPEGYYANLWLYAVLGGDTGTEDVASLLCVLGNTLYLTEREAQSEYLPLTEATPVGGTVATYNLVGNLVCIGRITTGVIEVGDGPICTYSFSQPLAFDFNVPPVPNIRDIPDYYKYVEGYSYIVTEIDRNRDLAVFHTDGEGGELSTTITLPEASAFGSGYWLRILSLSTYVGPAYLFVGMSNEGASPKIIWHGSSVGVESIATMQYFASVRLVSNGMDWVATDLSGTWTGNTTYCCDGNIKDGVQDNIVTIDEYGNIQDGGISSDSFEVPLTFSDSISREMDTVTLANDSASPGNLYYYGTNASGTKGWHLLPAGGDGGGSDMTVYSNIAGDFQVTWKDADEINIFGLPENINAVQIKRITRKPTGAAASVIKTRGTDLVCTWTPDGSIPLAGVIMTTSFGTLVTTDEYIIEIDGPPKGFNAVTDSTKAEVTNALYYCNDGLIADLTSDSVEIVKPLLSDGYNAFSLSVNIGADGDKLTVLATNDPAGTTGYYDITALALGVQAITVDGAYQTAEPLMFQWVKLVIDGHTDSIAVYMTRFRK